MIRPLLINYMFIVDRAHLDFSSHNYRIKPNYCGKPWWKKIICVFACFSLLLLVKLLADALFYYSTEKHSRYLSFLLFLKYKVCEISLFSPQSSNFLCALSLELLRMENYRYLKVFHSSRKVHKINEIINNLPHGASTFSKKIRR